ncbi:transposase [Mycobacterium kyorinense]|uniref:Transposase n=1 Tax=Mycobacterium kyorinense TaxID=487514 RepID=A0A1X1YMD3_9MYCO|nr:transposase [Mycobacterium kyorinense]
MVLVEHCRHARFVWNLAVEQQQMWQPGRRAPRYKEQSAQLTEIRAEYEWLAAGSQTVQQQALRDFAQAMQNFFAGDGSVVGIDRGVTVSAALSTGELLHTPSLTPGEQARLRRLQQRLARAQPGSNRRARTKLSIAKLKARETDRRRDWVEKTSTDLARRFDTIRVENLNVRAMTRSARGTPEQPGVCVAQKRGLNCAIHRQGWGWLVARLDYKAAGRLQRVPAAHTSQRCSACGHIAPENRKSQAVFACVACKAGPCNADVNAARNIAAGRAVPAQGDFAVRRSVNCEPQLSSPAA